eukprot:PLAT4282.1.p1 GENE.PLAT4282.1~~PLAT4282.1.p1  ORF type:complete len:279 (+),score=96.84 PLAT4282.1:117-953(+)
MFTLVGGLLRMLLSKPRMKLLILGVDNAGKTTVLEQMKGIFSNKEGMPPERITPTLGLNVGRLSIDGCDVECNDVGGGARFRSIWSSYYEDAHGLLFVVDASDEERFEEAAKTLHAVLEEEALAGVPLVILANKQDVPGAKSELDISHALRLGGCGVERPMHIVLASALTCEGLEAAGMWVVSAIKELGLHLREAEEDDAAIVRRGRRRRVKAAGKGDEQDDDEDAVESEEEESEDGEGSDDGEDDWEAAGGEEHHWHADDAREEQVAAAVELVVKDD